MLRPGGPRSDVPLTRTRWYATVRVQSSTMWAVARLLQSASGQPHGEMGVDETEREREGGSGREGEIRRPWRRGTWVAHTELHPRPCEGDPDARTYKHPLRPCIQQFCSPFSGESGRCRNRFRRVSTHARVWEPILSAAPERPHAPPCRPCRHLTSLPSAAVGTPRCLTAAMLSSNCSTRVRDCASRRRAATGRRACVRVAARSADTLVPPAWPKRVVPPEVVARDTPKVRIAYARGNSGGNANEKILGTSSCLPRAGCAASLRAETRCERGST
eukprot:124039-Chlamydomonas_euryale.AAC.6